MTWQEVSALIDVELAPLQDRVPDLADLSPALPGVPAALLALQSETRDRLDAAVREFAVTRRWPTLSLEEETMLCLRLEYAASLSFFFRPPLAHFPTVIPEPSLDLPDEHLIEWILVDVWNEVGLPQIHDTAARLLRGGAASTGLKNSAS